MSTKFLFAKECRRQLDVFANAAACQPGAEPKSGFRTQSCTQCKQATHPSVGLFPPQPPSVGVCRGKQEVGRVTLTAAR